jgi:hypothetical protein
MERFVEMRKRVLTMRLSADDDLNKD